MKIELETQDIEIIAQRVVELLKPLLASNGKQDDEILDLKGLCSYLHVSEKWVYERTHLKEIPHLKINGLLRFRKSEIDKWANGFKCPTVNSLKRILKAVK